MDINLPAVNRGSRTAIRPQASRAPREGKIRTPSSQNTNERTTNVHAKLRLLCAPVEAVVVIRVGDVQRLARRSHVACDALRFRKPGKTMAVVDDGDIRGSGEAGEDGDIGGSDEDV